MIPSFKWDVHVNIIVCTGPGLSCQVTALWKRLFWKEPAQMALSLWSSGPQRGTNYLWVLEGGGRMKGHSVAFREKEWKVFCFNEVLSAWPSAQGLHFFCLFLCFVCWVPITLHLRLSLLYKWGISVLQWSNNLPKVTAQLPELRHGCQGLKAERTKSRVE